MKKSSFVLIVVVVVIAIVIAAAYSNYYFNSTEYRFRDLVAMMKEVKHNEAIEEITLAFPAMTYLHVNIKPNKLSKREAYELGEELMSLLDDKFDEESEKRGGNILDVRIVISPVPGQEPSIGYGFYRSYNRETGKFEWEIHAKVD